jgi:Flp pilus assembly protein TadB
MELSRREQEILAQIEDEFTSREKGLAADLNAGPARRLRHSPVVRAGLGLAGLLVLGLLAVILLGVLLLELGPIGLCIVTAVVIVPWFVLAYARVNRGEPDD